MECLTYSSLRRRCLSLLVALKIIYTFLFMNKNIFYILIFIAQLYVHRAAAQKTMDTLHAVKITSMNRAQVIFLYKECKNDLYIQIDNFEDYRRLNYTVEGGELMVDKTNPHVFSICPRKPSVKLTVRYADSIMAEAHYRVRTVPRPKLYIQYQGRLLQTSSVLNKSSINDYTLVISSIGEYFYMECKEDTRWEASFRLQFIQKDDIIFESMSTDGKFTGIPKDLLRKTDRITIIPGNCHRINFKGEKLPYDLGTMPCDFDIH